MVPVQTAHRGTGWQADRPIVGLDRVRIVDAMTFSVLRLVEERGPLTALEVSDEIPLMMRLLGAGPGQPTLPLLHALEDRGLLIASLERPPRYWISGSGSEEAERLMLEFRPVVAARIARIEARVALLFSPEGLSPPNRRWSDEAGPGRDLI